MDIKNISLEKIKFDPKQPRQTLDKQKIAEMAQSIVTEGVINPVELDKTLTVITGEMRVRAAKLAGLKEIPCKIISINYKERFRRQVIENIHHNTMTDWDTAQALKKLLAEFPTEPGSVGTHGGKPNQGYTELGKLIGKTSNYISEKFDLLKASPSFQKAVKQGLPGTFTRVLSATPEPFKKIVEQKLIKGEIQNRDTGLRIADALRRQPEKSKQILSMDYSKHQSVNDSIIALGKIVPQRSDLIEKSFNNVESFSAKVDSLLDWLKKNPPETIGSLHAVEIVLGFKVLIDAINKWQKPIKQLN